MLASNNSDKPLAELFGKPDILGSIVADAHSNRGRPENPEFAGIDCMQTHCSFPNKSFDIGFDNYAEKIRSADSTGSFYTTD